MANQYLANTGAAAVAQADTLTVGGTVEAGDKFRVTLADAAGVTTTLSVSATTTNTTTTATEIATAFNASGDPRFTAVTAAGVGATVTLTADVAGVPFTCTVETVESNDAAADAQTFTRAATTANRSPSDWSYQYNHSGGTVPVSTDTYELDGRATAAITSGLNQSAVTLASLIQWQSLTHNIGTTAAALRISATLAEINKVPSGGTSGSGPALSNYDFGTNATTVTVWGSRNTGTGGFDAVILRGAHASNVLRVYGGSVGVATLKPGDTAQFPSVYLSGKQSRLTLASGVTAPTLITQDEGTLILRCGATTFTQNAGTATADTTATITTATISGTFTSLNTGTITTLRLEGQANVDLTTSNAARTIGVINIFGKNAKLKINLLTTVTSGINYYAEASSNQVAYPDGVNLAATAAA